MAFVDVSDWAHKVDFSSLSIAASDLGLFTFSLAFVNVLISAKESAISTSFSLMLPEIPRVSIKARAAKLFFPEIRLLSSS